MTTYIFVCSTCKRQIELQATIGNPPSKATCKECGGVLHRLWLSTPVVYKGDGFYTTDTRKDDPRS